MSNKKRSKRKSSTSDSEFDEMADLNSEDDDFMQFKKKKSDNSATTPNEKKLLRDRFGIIVLSFLYIL